MRFPLARVKGVTANIADRKIRLSFEIDLSQLGTAEELTNYIGEDAGTVVLIVEPTQLPLFDKDGQVTKQAEQPELEVEA